MTCDERDKVMTSLKTKGDSGKNNEEIKTKSGKIDALYILFENCKLCFVTNKNSVTLLLVTLLTVFIIYSFKRRLDVGFSCNNFVSHPGCWRSHDTK